MNLAVSNTQRWLPVLISLLAGVLFATVVCGQATPTHPGDVETNQPPIAGQEGPENPPAQVDVACESECESLGQVVMTNQSRRRFEPVQVCPGDDVWLISARNSHCAPSDLSRLQCSRLKGGRWIAADLEELVELHATDKTLVTFLYVHGNRTSLKWAKSRGLQFYKNAFRTEDRPPMRFVMFAWKSEVEKARICVDYEIKSKRSVRIGETFGKLLCRFEDRKMVVGGFSLGAQVVLTALTNPELQIQDDDLGKYRVAIFAPALNSSFVKSDLFTYPQNPIVHQTEFFLNKGDCAVKVSELIARRRTESSCSVRNLVSFEQINGHSLSIRDITCEINKRHSIVNYGRSRVLNIKMAEMLNATLAGSCSCQELASELLPRTTVERELDIQESEIVVESTE